MRYRFQRLMAATTGLTFVLMLLGIYTAASGSGLACAARWPFCDGWLGLFPATFPSFIEWFHRLVAMITGFVILGTTYAAWKRADNRRVMWTLVLAVLLLPFQITLGAVTVTLGGIFPWGYAPIVQISHYAVALAILALLTTGIALLVEHPSRSRRQRVMAATLVLLPVQYLFSYGTLFVYSTTVQIIYYALSLAMFVLLVSVTVWIAGESASLAHLRRLSLLGVGLLVAQMLLGRRLWGTIIPPIVSDTLSLALLIVLLPAVWLVFWGERSARSETTKPVKEHPLAATVVLSVVGYVLVVGTFWGVVDIFPEIGRETVLLFSDAIAVINSLALAALLAGYAFIRRGDIRRHRVAMLTAFSLIMVFLVVYLWKVGGGFEKQIVISQGQFLAAYAGLVKLVYLAMLAVHILLSAIAVPVVIYPVVLGLTHTPAELTRTAHARVGRIAVVAWSLSLFLGVVTYFLLNHVYSWAPR